MSSKLGNRISGRPIKTRSHWCHKCRQHIQLYNSTPVCRDKAVKLTVTVVTRQPTANVEPTRPTWLTVYLPSQFLYFPSNVIRFPTHCHCCHWTDSAKLTSCHFSCSLFLFMYQTEIHSSTKLWSVNALFSRMDLKKELPLHSVQELSRYTGQIIVARHYGPMAFIFPNWIWHANSYNYIMNWIQPNSNVNKHEEVTKLRE